MKLFKYCLICKKKFSKPFHCSAKDWENVRRFCSRKCKSQWMKQNFSGKNSWSWKGGTIAKNGYRIIRINGKRIGEHRFIMEEFLKRKLKPIEQIHHKNGNKIDNRIENLELFNIISHSKFHYPKGSKFGINQVKLQ